MELFLNDYVIEFMISVFKSNIFDLAILKVALLSLQRLFSIQDKFCTEFLYLFQEMDGFECIEALSQSSNQEISNLCEQLLKLSPS